MLSVVLECNPILGGNYASSGLSQATHSALTQSQKPICTVYMRQFFVHWVFCALCLRHDPLLQGGATLNRRLGRVFLCSQIRKVSEKALLVQTLLRVGIQWRRTLPRHIGPPWCWSLPFLTWNVLREICTQFSADELSELCMCVTQFLRVAALFAFDAERFSD